MYTTSLTIGRKVNISGAHFRAGIEESEECGKVVFGPSNGHPERELPVRLETFCGQRPCSNSTSLKSLKLKNVAPVLLRRSL